MEKRCEEVVAYLVEAGADPNQRCQRPGGDAPLHLAASRGMAEMVRLLCTSARTDVNLRNGAGLTALLCATSNHGVIDEQSQCLVNSKPSIRALLHAGADATITDANNGRNLLHYAVLRADPELIHVCPFSDA